MAGKGDWPGGTEANGKAEERGGVARDEDGGGGDLLDEGWRAGIEAVVAMLCAESEWRIPFHGGGGEVAGSTTLLLLVDKPLNWIGSFGRDGSGACRWKLLLPSPAMLTGRARPLTGRLAGCWTRTGLGDAGC